LKKPLQTSIIATTCKGVRFTTTKTTCSMNPVYIFDTILLRDKRNSSVKHQWMNIHGKENNMLQIGVYKHCYYSWHSPSQPILLFSKYVNTTTTKQHTSERKKAPIFNLNTVRTLSQKCFPFANYKTAAIQTFSSMACWYNVDLLWWTKIVFKDKESPFRLVKSIQLFDKFHVWVRCISFV
jgi:hypothetical protein